MSLPRIWLVDADASILSQFSDVLSSEGYAVENITEKPVEFRGERGPAVVVLNLIESGTPGLNVLMSAQRAVPPIPVLVLAAPNQIRLVVEALKLGASDALVAPVEPSDLLLAIRMAQRKQLAEPGLPQKLEFLPDVDPSIFLSRSERMLEIWDTATMVARTDVPVLILGESGVGKGVLARFIHRHSKRADKAVVKVNCAALPHDLLESELFGYERGAFTGAVSEKPGKFELAHQGSIILDEIGEMTPSLQAKLLHVLEDGEFSKLGGRRPVRVDARVFALSNRRLDEARGEFRDDLYFRLNVVKINIPPLRERKEDIPLLCQYFVKKHREALGSSLQDLAPDLVEAFMQYNWPGNVRQLENAVRRHLILPKLDSEISAAAVRAPRAPDAPKAAIAAVPGRGADMVPFPAPEDSVCLKMIAATAADRAEREVVLRVLEQSNWNRRRAAQRLNICYKALLNKLKKWQIQRRRAS